MMKFVKIISIVFVNIFLALSSAFASCDYLPRVNDLVPVSAIESNSFQQDAIFSSSSEELSKQVGGLSSGNNLYLYSDWAYIYTEWADIMQETIFDKGSWEFIDGCVFLTSDSDIKWKTNNPKTLIALRRNKVADEVFLLGVDKDLDYFEDNSGDNPELMLLLKTLKRIKFLKSKVKQSDLISRAWRPIFFESN